MASTEKEPVMVQVDLEKFIEDLWKMADDDYEYDKVQLMEDLVRNGLVGTEDGCIGVISVFDNLTVVCEDDFEDGYPKYAKVMTWDEFVENECFFYNGKYGVMDE